MGSLGTVQHLGGLSKEPPNNLTGCILSLLRSIKRCLLKRGQKSFLGRVCSKLQVPSSSPCLQLMFLCTLYKLTTKQIHLFCPNPPEVIMRLSWVPLLSFHLYGGLFQDTDREGLLLCIVSATRMLEPVFKIASGSKRIKCMTVTLLPPYLGSLAGIACCSPLYFLASQRQPNNPSQQSFPSSLHQFIEWSCEKSYRPSLIQIQQMRKLKIQRRTG